ncbi:hypothetical protein D1007_38865 [Hordeum vulgare]|uniref:Uncharacterized protein n=1 Tax=Hordeum vulgare subsp. vulgare TaxID=112509 RepID=A0A8I6Z3G2_HORVV|nr:uncharacterized protein LOC123402474 [Hordeum vulgare subsp. vulgare]KAE8787248.1 hypothetical protein D1007_38865 [Hordeum vulgare]KAI4966420.1 hypothetical protein ZWY2020_040989 [Hordeum vulgare]
MRGRRRGSSGTATDFLVCFPPRAHLALMPPKTACSPSRPSASSERRHSTSGARPSSSRVAANRNPSRRHHAVDVGEDNEPTSPKVTCAGQIKVSRSAKPKGGLGAAGGKKKATWMQALGIKKDALPFLNALHGAFRLNVSGCFGRFPGAVVEYTSGEEDEEDEEQVGRAGKETDRHGDALAKWFMVLEEGKRVPRTTQEQELKPGEEDQEDAAPPANALMLMRCRSAPAKGLARRLGVADAGEDEEAKSDSNEAKEEEAEKENLVVMRYPPDFFQVSMDIAKETWIVGGDDSILRCRSWKK